MANLSDVQIMLSGGSSNTSPAAALGAAISEAAGGEVLSQTATGLTTLTGVVINDARGNATGSGTLTYTSTTTSLTWRPPSGTTGTAVDVSGGGDFAIQGASDGGYLDVTVTAGLLPSSTVSNTITIANRMNKVFDDVTKDESEAGMTDYRCLYLLNGHSADAMNSVKLWVGVNTNGQDVVQLGTDAAGKNGTAATIADENTAPTGAVFGDHISEATAIDIGDLDAGDYYPFWIKRTVPAGVTESTDENTFRLTFKIKV